MARSLFIYINLLFALLCSTTRLLGQVVTERPDLKPTAAQAHPLDLEARSKFAVLAMQNTIDPDQHVPWIMAYLTPTFHFDAPTAMIAGEYLDGLTMARIITGSHAGDPTEDEMRYAVVHAFEDGLSSGTIQGALDNESKANLVELTGHKHLLPSLLTLHRFDPSKREPLELVKKSLRKFREIANEGQLEDGRPYLFFPVAPSVPDPGMFSFIKYDRVRGWEGLTREPIDTGSAGFQGAVVLPFAQYYQLTKDPMAAEFLDLFIRFLRERATDFNSDGSFTKRDTTNGQVCSRLMTNEGVLIYGLASGKPELVSWSRNVFDQLQKHHGTSFGWIPESLSFVHGLGCETDSMTAYLETALLLARYVDDSYWESAERISMNQLMQQQILDVAPLDDAKALLGGFASFGGPNDWFVPEGPYLTQSCHGSGMRSLYNVWYHTAWWEQGASLPVLRVNMHWSKNLPDAQIVSNLPGSTKLDLVVKRPCEVVVRKPDWADMSKINVTAGPEGGPSTSVEAKLAGRWLHLGAFDQPTRIQISFPNEISTRKDVIHEHRKNEDIVFTTQWRGNLVLNIEPSGKRRPNYARIADDTSAAGYVAKYTADEAFDPISMTPPQSTSVPRAADTVELFQSPAGHE